MIIIIVVTLAAISYCVASLAYRTKKESILDSFLSTKIPSSSYSNTYSHQSLKSTMPKFRKRPVVIQAIQYTGKNGGELRVWSQGAVVESPVIEVTDDNPSGEYVQIKILEGTMTGCVGDWIIKGVMGEFYPCKNEIFIKTYEQV